MKVRKFPGLCCVFAALTMAAALAGCQTTSGTAGGRPALLESATATYLAGDGEEAIRLYTDFLGSQPSTAQASEAYLGRGTAYYDLGRYRLAEADFANSERMARDRGVRARAMLRLAHAIFAQDRYAEAAKLYMRVLRSHKGYVAQDEALYRLGIALARQGQWEDARAYLEDVLSRWPNGEFAKLARAKLPCVMGRHFTVQVGAFTKRELAETKVGELREKGFQGEVVPIDMAGVPGYAARSGRLATWAQAQDHAGRLERAGFSTYALP